MKPIYYSRTANNYYHLGKCTCEGCNDEIIDQFYMVELDKKKEKHASLSLCSRCFQENKKSIFAPIMQFKMVIISEIIPIGAIPVIQSKPELADGHLSIYDVSDIKSVKTVDRTVHSNRTNWEGAKIGIMPEQRTKRIEVDDFFKQLKLAKPDIPKELKHDG